MLLGHEMGTFGNATVGYTSVCECGRVSGTLENYEIAWDRQQHHEDVMAATWPWRVETAANASEYGYPLPGGDDHEYVYFLTYDEAVEYVRQEAQRDLDNAGNLQDLRILWLSDDAVQIMTFDGEVRHTAVLRVQDNILEQVRDLLPV